MLAYCMAIVPMNTMAVANGCKTGNPAKHDYLLPNSADGGHRHLLRLQYSNPAGLTGVRGQVFSSISAPPQVQVQPHRSHLSHTTCQPLDVPRQAGAALQRQTFEQRWPSCPPRPADTHPPILSRLLGHLLLSLLHSLLSSFLAPPAASAHYPGERCGRPLVLQD
jgi:hypothetical protein